MSIFAISDLHLSFGSNKPMDVFNGWGNHTERIKANWQRLVKPQDTVVLPGDFSWSLKLEDAVEDFRFLEKLPGKKILLKGNHDLWWSTTKKLKAFLEQNGIFSVETVYNNCYVAENFAIAGTRGWFYDEAGTKKVKLREAGRLETSLKAAENTGLPILTFLHYPPFYNGCLCEEIFSVLKKHNVTEIFHGHIHGAGFNKAATSYDGIKFNLISCDCIDFTPLFIG